MKKLNNPILFITSLLMFYTISPFIGVPHFLIFLMFAVSPFAIIWLVIKILKDGKHSGRELKDRYFYEDAEHIRSESEMG